MSPTPLPTQLSGAQFLAERDAALLADEPRVGKTGAAIIAADYVFAETILVVTTASGRGVWDAGLRSWSAFPRDPQILTPSRGLDANRPIAIVGWPSIADPKTRAALMRRRWDLVIGDESHNAKNPEAKRTAAFYGEFLRDGAQHSRSTGAIANAARVWPLTGTPLPHSPADLYPMMRALWPGRLAADGARGWPDVTVRGDFLHRYCIVRMKRISQFNRIPVVIGGRNLPELRERLDGLMLRRTQKDVGIQPPRYGILPLIVSDRMKREAEGDIDRAAVIAAAEAGDTKSLEMHLGPIRRLTGEIKAKAVVEAVKDEFDGGLDKIVIMYWHREVGRILADGLSRFGVVCIDGSTRPTDRTNAVDRFASETNCRVFLGQIVAAGEAIDLSAAAVLWFAETSFTPKDMAQAALRITNHQQKRQAVVKVAALAGSIDEALQSRLLTLWTAIREVLNPC